MYQLMRQSSTLEPTFHDTVVSTRAWRMTWTFVVRQKSGGTFPKLTACASCLAAGAPSAGRTT